MTRVMNQFNRRPAPPGYQEAMQNSWPYEEQPRGENLERQRDDRNPDDNEHQEGENLASSSVS